MWMKSPALFWLRKKNKAVCGNKPIFIYQTGRQLTTPIQVNPNGMNKYIISVLFLFLFSRNVFSQPVELPLRKPDVISFGVGFGFDYGGILGASLLAYPC